MSHTPGPWKVGNSGRTIGKLAQNGSMDLIANIEHSCFPEDQEANARLLASAPALLEALREQRRQMEFPGLPEAFTLTMKRMLDKAISNAMKGD